VFNSARELLFLTEEEGDFVRRRFCMPDSRGEVAGAGLDISDDACSGAEWEELSSRIGESKFIAYVGRVDESKGCAVLLEYFRRYVAERPDCDINLVLVGDDVMKTWEHPRIIRAGFVSRKCRDAVIRNCAFLAMPSPFESLCFAVLEAWALGRPVLVNGNCSVLRAHCERSNGGLWYTDYEQFRECTDRLLGGERLSRTLGEQGRAYVEADYTWDRTIGVYTRALARAAGRPAAGEVS
jgi:glycosyltransferase involved in cell wall biosynthesis